MAAEAKSSDSDCLLLASGGPDSTTLLYHLLKKENKKPMLAYFGVDNDSSRAEKEVVSQLAKEHGLDVQSLDVNPLVDLHSGAGAGAMLMNGFTDAIPFGVECALMQAVSIASAKGFKKVYVGFHSNDRDCVPHGTEELINLVCRMHKTDITVEAPFRDQTKAQVLEYGVKLGVKLENTITCTRMTGNKACSECGACKLRSEAMKQMKQMK